MAHCFQGFCVPPGRRLRFAGGRFDMAHKKGQGSSRNGRDSKAAAVGSQEIWQRNGHRRQHPYPPARDEMAPGPQRRPGKRRHALCADRRPGLLRPGRPPHQRPQSRKQLNRPRQTAMVLVGKLPACPLFFKRPSAHRETSTRRRLTTLDLGPVSPPRRISRGKPVRSSRQLAPRVHFPSAESDTFGRLKAAGSPRQWR